MKELVRGLCPPLLWRLIANLRNRFVVRQRRMFRGVYESFKDVSDQHPWTRNAYHDACRQILRECRSHVLPPFAETAHGLLAFTINTLPRDRVPRILDWAGGTGLRYWTTRPALDRPVHWYVIDKPELASISRETMGSSNELVFAGELPLPESSVFDVVLIYSSLQYVEAQSELLATLASYRPRFIVLPRLMARTGNGYVTSQKVQGFDTPCKVSSIEEIVETLQSRQYVPVLMIRDGIDLSPLFEDDVPESLRVGKEWFLIFKRISQ